MDVGESQTYDAELKKPEIKEYRLYGFIYMKSQKRQKKSIVTGRTSLF